MKSGVDWLDQSKHDLLWVEIPRGGKLRASKLEALEQIFIKFANAEKIIPCVLALGWDYTSDAKPLQYPHERWTRILAAWRPKTKVVCTCQIHGPLSRYHCRYRVFYSGLTDTKPAECDSDDIDSTGKYKDLKMHHVDAISRILFTGVFFE